MTDTFNDRGQVDLIDMQSNPDGEFRWILHYQDHLTKFTYLRAIRKKSLLLLFSNYLRYNIVIINTLMLFYL